MSDYASEPQGVAPKLIAGIVVIVALAAGVGGYAIHEHNAAQNLAASNASLAASNAQSTAALNATQQQLSDLAAKVNTLAAREETPPPSTVRTASASRAVAARRAEDSRFKKLQSQLDAQGQAINQTESDLASTQGDLSNTRTELTGSIAHTHDELVLLEKKGERNYAEFDITKSKQFQREGSMEIRLRKADSKHQFADLDLMVNDRNLTQKHVNLFQPVMFYTPDSPQPIEAVINSIGKDHIHGYVSSPKYNQSDLASMANASENPANATTTGNPSQSANQQRANSGNPQPASSTTQAASTRQRLPMPQ